jgi:hypothetical protein
MIIITIVGSRAQKMLILRYWPSIKKFLIGIKNFFVGIYKDIKEFFVDDEEDL